tara:strand:+ start:16617 stop:18338 length:1722 start_codon:yes stop_codon:yes gene_type:complete
MEKRWTLAPTINQNKVSKLSESLNELHPILTELLVQRGIDDFEKAKEFFRPNLKSLHNPFLMKDMDLAVERIQEAIKNEEKILIYGDYDVDGTTSVALVYGFLIEFYPNLAFYIPDRYSEGYGISIQGIDYAADNDFSLIIALDCGIKAVEKIDYATSKGVDFIICDHHTPGENIPKAIAVLDPKQKDCKYPFKELSGCGVGFKLMQAFAEKEKIPFEKLVAQIDLLAVSICADIVPIVGENRIFTHFGIKKLNENPQKGLKAMLEVAQNKKKNYTVTDIVFTIAPRINAAGRIKSGEKAVEALLSGNAEEALENSSEINLQNTDRKELDKAITEEALLMIDGDEVLMNQKTTVLFQAHWHKGVIGIVASRCIEKYYRPTIILTESNGKAAGSARSVKGFSVYDALEQCSEVLEQFGGHKYAAGMTLPLENVASFQQKFEEVVASTIPEELLIPEIEIDNELKLSDIDGKFYRILEQFAPFGPENMKPVFLSKNVLVKGAPRIVGNNHLKVAFFNEENPNVVFDAIGFNLGEKMELLRNDNPIDIVFTVEENEWNGNVTLQLNLKDLKKSEKY